MSVGVLKNAKAKGWRHLKLTELQHDTSGLRERFIIRVIVDPSRLLTTGSGAAMCMDTQSHRESTRLVFLLPCV